MALETKHSFRVDNMKLAVLYVTAGQTDMPTIFANKPPENNRFWNFLEILGEKVDMTKWDRYRGDLGTYDVRLASYFSFIQANLEQMFKLHLISLTGKTFRSCSTLPLVWTLNNTEDLLAMTLALSSILIVRTFTHRLFRSSQMPWVLYHTYSQWFNPEEPQMPIAWDFSAGKSYYQLATVFSFDLRLLLPMITRPNVPAHGPSNPPTTHYFDASSMKNYLLTKLHNGYAAARACPPMKNLFTVPRKAALKDLAEKYPKDTKKGYFDDCENFNIYITTLA